MTQGEETGGRQRDAAAGYRPVDLAIAASLLTRLPVPVDHALAGRRIARAGWAYPLVGAAIGVFFWTTHRLPAESQFAGNLYQTCCAPPWSPGAKAPGVLDDGDEGDLPAGPERAGRT